MHWLWTCARIPGKCEWRREVSYAALAASVYTERAGLMASDGRGEKQSDGKVPKIILIKSQETWTFSCLSQRWTKHFVAAQTSLKKKNKSRKKNVFKTFVGGTSNYLAKVCFALRFSVICPRFGTSVDPSNSCLNILHFAPFNCYTSLLEVWQYLYIFIAKNGLDIIFTNIKQNEQHRCEMQQERESLSLQVFTLKGKQKALGQMKGDKWACFN